MECVVGIAAVRIDRHQWRIIGDQVLPLESLEKPLLDFVFVGSAVTHSAADFLKSGGGDGVNRIASGKVSFYLFFGQRRFKLRYQIAGADHVLAQSANQIDGASIDQRNCEDQIVR